MYDQTNNYVYIYIYILYIYIYYIYIYIYIYFSECIPQLLRWTDCSLHSLLTIIMLQICHKLVRFESFFGISACLGLNGFNAWWYHSSDLNNFRAWLRAKP